MEYLYQELKEMLWQIELNPGSSNPFEAVGSGSTARLKVSLNGYERKVHEVKQFGSKWTTLTWSQRSVFAEHNFPQPQTATNLASEHFRHNDER